MGVPTTRNTGRHGLADLPQQHGSTLSTPWCPWTDRRLQLVTNPGSSLKAWPVERFLRQLAGPLQLLRVVSGEVLLDRL